MLIELLHQTSNINNIVKINIKRNTYSTRYWAFASWGAAELSILMETNHAKHTTKTYCLQKYTYAYFPMLSYLYAAPLEYNCVYMYVQCTFYAW